MIPSPSQSPQEVLPSTLTTAAPAHSLPGARQALLPFAGQGLREGTFLRLFQMGLFVFVYFTAMIPKISFSTVVESTKRHSAQPADC